MFNRPIKCVCKSLENFHLLDEEGNAIKICNECGQVLASWKPTEIEVELIKDHIHVMKVSEILK